MSSFQTILCWMLMFLYGIARPNSRRAGFANSQTPLLDITDTFAVFNL